jgi:hypothetical protein
MDRLLFIGIIFGFICFLYGVNNGSFVGGINTLIIFILFLFYIASITQRFALIYFINLFIFIAILPKFIYLFHLI